MATAALALRVMLAVLCWEKKNKRSWMHPCVSRRGKYRLSGLHTEVEGSSGCNTGSVPGEECLAQHTCANQQTRRSSERLTKSCIVPLTLYLKNSKQKIKSLNVYFNMCVDAIRGIRYFTVFILAFTNVKEHI